MPSEVWHEEDPRHTINKRGTIVVVRPVAPGIDRCSACVAFVDTKSGYYVHTEFEAPYNRISVDDDWPEGWLWIWAPEVK